MPGSLSGRILIARPVLTEPSFYRSVVYLVEHDEEGAVGVIINRPTDVELAGRLDEVDELIGGGEVFHEGGPVDQSSVIALGADPLERPRMFDLQSALDGGPQPADLRIYVGYAGWGPGQLDGEVIEGAWLVAREVPGPGGHRSDVFTPHPEGLWRELLRREAPPASGLALYPEDLRSN